jgi:hypothetical protein
MFLLICKEDGRPVMIVDSNTFFEKFDAGAINTQTGYFGIIRMREINGMKYDFFVRRDENGLFKFVLNTSVSTNANITSLDMVEDRDEIQKMLD